MRNLLKVGLRRFVQAQSRYAIGDRHAVVIAVAAQKGGVGKTTTSVNLAAGLARYHNKRVLLVDLDPQGHVATALKCQIHPGGQPLSAILEDDKNGTELLDAVTTTSIPGLDVPPYDDRLTATEDLLGTRIGKEMILKDKIRITRSHYDVILLDCPPHLGNLTINGLCAADQVLIPCDPSPLALKGVEALIHSVATIAARLNPEIDLMGVLLTRVDGRNTNLNTSIVSQIEESYGEGLLPVRIGINSSLAKAQSEGRDIFAFDQKCRGASQYRALADHVVELLG
ncbi:MAG: AAA family ATPase [Rhodobacterales bacterium]|nr:AAA family ATPase [Rhodobacterales bacterium]